MKGLSPLISAMLLIAIVISVGSFLTAGLMQTVREGTNQPQFACTTSTYYIVESVMFNESGDNMLAVKVLNSGSTDLYGFSLLLFDGNKTVLLNSTAVDQSGVTKSSPLKRGRAALLKTELDDFGNNLKEVIVLNEVCGVVSAKKEL